MKLLAKFSKIIGFILFYPVTGSYELELRSTNFEVGETQTLLKIIYYKNIRQSTFARIGKTESQYRNNQ